MFRYIKKHIFNILHPTIGEVWELHRVTDEEPADINQREYEITPQRLENLIAEYKQNNFEFISVETLPDRLKNKNSKHKFIVVTLDDGYQDNLTHALPIFEKYNVPFCIFITKNYIQQGYPPYKMLQEQQIQQLAKHPLCTIGSHTLSHSQLSKLTEQQQTEEITECKKWLEELTQKKTDIFAFPSGYYNKTTLQVLQQNGIRLSFAAWGGPLRKRIKYNQLTIPRIIITEKGMKI